jgi:hypothetical protein
MAKDDKPLPPAGTSPMRKPFLTRVAYKPEAKLFWETADGRQTCTVSAPTIIGSSKDAPVRIVDPAISGLHVAVEPRSDGIRIRDLRSRNGTFYERASIEAALIPDGGRIRIGDTTITFALTRSDTETPLHPDAEYRGMIGSSEVMRELFMLIETLARTTAPIFVHGETGTGKELVSRALHEASGRKGPLVTVDCGGLVADLIESELFGHTRGSFSGAVKDRIGAAEAADRGTLFIDEVGELPLALQPKLLRLIEERTYRRVGETNHRKFDAGMIFATHRDLRQMVNLGQSARTSTTGSPCTASSCRRCASAARTSSISTSASCRRRCAALRRRPRTIANSRRCRGRGTSAGCAPSPSARSRTGSPRR